MRLHRFYTKEKINLNEELTLLDKDLINQIRNVFRMQKGDGAIFFDGNGFDYVSEISMLEKMKMIIMPKEKKESVMPKKEITLFQALIKKDNFEMIAEKCTEVGVTSFVPVLCERSEKKNLNIERVEKILKEASEQSGRGDIPKVFPIMELFDLPFGEMPIFVADFGGEEIKKIIFPDKCGILIGPEGGFSEEERNFLKDLAEQKEGGVKIFSLGDTVLRAETAAIVASDFALNR
ncbi:MAG: RsmE family RNA methyltransferase [Candidatus Paceibacterota bacterium]